ncbi:M20 metallopeptidase family protein [Virgisporangium aurantiacum]|uniref:M20 metallopeptidase family protein n=1 Tax=Virgisporangium aurantiacum TaxID=175570 RepID=UPI0019519670|nr:M20/M25/M40 family metallo-hydrolase [Virgisporangium aurantiacum]
MRNLASRRAVLGAAVGVAGAALAPSPAAHAADDAVDTVDAVASRLDRDLINLRRDIHQHPETAGQERRTAALVAHRLRAAGLAVTTGVGGHGVVGLLTGARPGRTVAYRADMDAVPPEDQVGGGTLPAHVCGHDVHTTVGVGVAQVLARLRHRLAGTVMFVFQPAEEDLSGAAAMLADGMFRHARPVEIHALHCGPVPVGQFAVMPGFGQPGIDRGTATLTGADAPSHAQQLAADIRSLGTVAPPANPADIEQLLVDLQIPGGPLAEFVYVQQATASGAEVQVSYRCWPQERYVAVRADIRRLASSYGATVAFPDEPFPAMVCPERESLELRRYLGGDRTATLHAAFPFKGEDFALFLDRLPGTYAILGVRAPGAGIETSLPHLGTFTPDERAIGHGVRAMAGWLARRTR